ncbi:MAG: redox-sensing transcriptional repressor Rex [Bacteroidales bacterium]|nr:redox-sensing transcriptional repressor Rex [Bacteroidales bacterium]
MESTAYTKRLLTYRLSLSHLKEVGLTDVFSYLIAGETGISAALVRKDLAQLKVKGKRRGGYEIDVILDAINNYFGDNTINRVVLAGMGNIGRAIVNYKNFENRRIKIVAAFDLDPAKQRKKYDVPVYPMEKCPDIVDKYRVNVAVIAVPAFSAQTVCDRLIQCGIRGIMNFAPVNLKVPDHVYISNVRLCDELQQVIYHSTKTNQ